MFSSIPTNVTNLRKGNYVTRLLKRMFDYVDYPVIALYRGYGNRRNCIVQGHVYHAKSKIHENRRFSLWQNFIAIIQKYLHRPASNIELEIEINGKCFRTTSQKDGHFVFSIQNHALDVGWHEVSVKLLTPIVDQAGDIQVRNEILIQDSFPVGIISDIDDTVILSHSVYKLKKFYTLISKDGPGRAAVEGISKLYQNILRMHNPIQSPIFYVSSSEWNLYALILQFMTHNRFPKGILLLKALKTNLREIFQSGYGSHDHKIEKITSILEMYPDQEFFLFGDNGQHDASIYAQLVEQNGSQIRGVFIRKAHNRKYDEVDRILRKIAKSEIPSLQFEEVKEVQAFIDKNDLLKFN